MLQTSKLPLPWSLKKYIEGMLRYSCLIFAFAIFNFSSYLLQKDNVLTELFEYANPEHPRPFPGDRESVLLTRDYLVACSKLFEKGLLNHEKITQAKLEVLSNINSGYEYFMNWY